MLHQYSVELVPVARSIYWMYLLADFCLSVLHGLEVGNIVL